MRLRKKAVATAALGFFACVVPLHGQGLTGQISGTVSDSSGAAIARAEVGLANRLTGQVRSTRTSDDGHFVFAELLPGTFSLTITADGFKKFEQKDVVLSATERLTLPPIALEVGQLTETVSVTAETARVQTESAERSGLISSREMQELPLKGRDYMGMAKLLPGITDTANREYPVANNLVGINVNGTRAGSIALNIDGVTNLDTGSDIGPNHVAPSMDAISEMKVLLSNYQAEYGRSSGGTINVVIKNGTHDFHGGAYYFFRNEALNANEFFNNRNGQPRPRYRFNYPGYFLGGPVLFPHSKFNHNRDKLFFFWSQEFLPLTVPSNISNQTFPTALERQGDFSKSFDQSGKLVPITDPLSRTVFPGNIVPANRIDHNGQKLLSVFPLPNAAGPGGTYNWTGQSINNQPRRDSILRLDYNIASTTQFYVRLIQDYQSVQGFFGLTNALGGSNLWPQLPIKYDINAGGLVATLIHTFSATRVNEFTFGVNRGQQQVAALSQTELDAMTRSKIGLNLPQFFPQANPLGLIPNATFAGVTNAAPLNIEQRFPFFGTNNIWSYSDNFSNIIGPHNIKAGIYIEHSARNSARSTSFNGTFSFNRDANNPLDTNYPYSNAILGVVDTYTESNAHPASRGRFSNVEWFVQDTWKAARRLTIDAGVRLYWMQPTISANQDMTAFDLATYSSSKQPPLIQPYIDPGTKQRVGRDPVTGQLLPAVAIGSFSGAAGTPFQGMKLYHESIVNTPPIKVGPRIGLAWDVFGDGKTAVRTGFGIFYDRFPDDQVNQLTVSPPLVTTSTANYTTISNLMATPLSQSPAAVIGIQRDFSPPAVYNWSFGIQQNIGFGTLLDIAYVGNVQRHLLDSRNLNALPYGTNFLPSSIDPTVAGNKPLPANFLRPIPGYQDISYLEFAGIGNYNALQVQATKRFSRDFTYHLVYSWSKALDLVDTNSADVNPVLNYRSRNYGRAAFDRHQSFIMNYVYSLPAVSRHWNSRFSRVAFDGWEISGITSFITGAPAAISYALTTATDLTGATGAGIDTRVVLIGDVNAPAPAGQKFNVNAVKPPTPAYSVNGIGNASKSPITAGGINNWDLSLFKNFRLGQNEARRLQFRFETYNTFNHTQFSTVDTAARFDPAANQVNTDLGYYTAAGLGRRLALGVKLYF